MYIPNHFKETDKDKIINFIRENSFATLINISDGQINANHIPLEIEEFEDKNYFLTGHMAKADSQWQELQDNEQVLVIFNGPDSYISPQWYNELSVPTWNYTAVHIHGKAKIIFEQNEIIEILKKQLKKYESKFSAPFDFNSYEMSFLEAKIKGIVGIKIEIAKIEAKFKLSQNRENEIFNLIKGLEQAGGLKGTEITKYMRDYI